MHLHAREIVVPLYRNKPPIKVTAPVPAHMKERLQACGWIEAMDSAGHKAARPVAAAQT